MRTLALFLQRSLSGSLHAVGPLDEEALLMRLVHTPPVALQPLLEAHVDALIGGYRDGATIRPTSLPATTLWVAALLNNLAWATQHPNDRLLTVSLRLVRALPPAPDMNAALAYHSILCRLDDLAPPATWQPVVRLLLIRSPLTAAWLPSLDAAFDWALFEQMLEQLPLRFALFDRWLALLPDPADPQALTTQRARANHELGRLLGALLQRDPQWQPLVATFYEADCHRQRRGDEAHPTWPLLDALRASRQSNDPRQRQHAKYASERYRPLVALRTNPALLRTYSRLDSRFLEQIGEVVRR